LEEFLTIIKAVFLEEFEEAFPGQPISILLVTIRSIGFRIESSCELLGKVMERKLDQGGVLQFGDFKEVANTSPVCFGLNVKGTLDTPCCASSLVVFADAITSPHLQAPCHGHWTVDVVLYDEHNFPRQCRMRPATQEIATTDNAQEHLSSDAATEIQQSEILREVSQEHFATALETLIQENQADEAFALANCNFSRRENGGWVQYCPLGFYCLKSKLLQLQKNSRAVQSICQDCETALGIYRSEVQNGVMVCQMGHNGAEHEGFAEQAELIQQIEASRDSEDQRVLADAIQATTSLRPRGGEGERRMETTAALQSFNHMVIFKIIAKYCLAYLRQDLGLARTCRGINQLVRGHFRTCYCSLEEEGVLRSCTSDDTDRSSDASNIPDSFQLQFTSSTTAIRAGSDIVHLAATVDAETLKHIKEKNLNGKMVMARAITKLMMLNRKTCMAVGPRTTMLSLQQAMLISACVPKCR
jgi:hypothetical protein